ncbi:mannitol dehydrogenase family protein [Microbacterium sp. STN6]|uniref:mannitol dehydrogenase family protein n=1 Tax=Microbacterium sp. STN6 TaxID=2995588 RepID=UPI002260F041|nr:mannitol dehydrogenase family protein [Microbacterium sp. STN6]MCX7521810.1 mannitol dehydrogenase family protein [Microbacterium sp. STN6]
MTIAIDAAALALPAALNRRSLAERTGGAIATAPVRIVHMGLGAFHRAHQAWYTAMADDAAEWGIASFTGRSATVAEQLAPQDGLYTLVERSDAGDRVETVTSVVEAVDGARLDRFVELVSAPSTAIVTLTITEPGYRLTSDGLPDGTDAAVVADIAWLSAALSAPGTSIDAPAAASADVADGRDSDTGPTTSLGRLLYGLDARRRRQAGPLALVPCDNIPDNGEFVRTGLLALARAVSAETAAWIETNVSFVSTSVDRITPRTTADDVLRATELSGWIDRAPVVTEPFRDWVLSGAFPGGRPAWETAGARFVDDIEPFERRKLWLLNGAHSLLAYAGPLRGYETVAQAIGDPQLRAWVNELWDEAAHHLPAEELDLDSYRQALLDRFDNARIEHRLAQIGMEGVTKLRVRIAAIARSERAAGRDAAACARALGAWVARLTAGEDLPDAQSALVQAARAGDAAGASARLVALLDGTLAADAAFVAAVDAAAASFR